MASDIKKEEVEPLKKSIEKGITEGKDVKKVRENIIKRCLGKLVKFLLKDFVSKKEKSDISKEEKSDTEWLKDYRKREEEKKKRDAYEMLISTSLTSFLIAAVMFYVIKQFESFQGIMADFGAGLINTLLIIFHVIFWISLFVFLITLGIVVYKRYIDYKKNKELKAKKEQEKKEGMKKEQVETSIKKGEEPAKTSQIVEKQAKNVEIKQYAPLTPQLRKKLENIYESNSSRRISK